MGSGLDRSAGRQKIASLPYCVCRGDHWSPANLPPQRIFRDGFLARQTGTGEQCSPLQAFFGSSAEGSRPLPTEQKEKSASKETCPGQINPAPAHKRQSCNNGKAAGRALGGAQRAPPVCYANTLLRLIAPRGQTLCAPQFRCAQLWPHAHNPAPHPQQRDFSLLLSFGHKRK